MMSVKILILTDDKNFFATKLVDIELVGKRRTIGGTMDISRIRDYFLEHGAEVLVSSYSRLDYTQDYSGWFVVYASSEARGQFEKSFMEDTLLYLQTSGAYLIPDFKYFRAHENKVFQELLRTRFRAPSLKHPASRVYQDYHELRDEFPYPVIVKSASGSGSTGVQKADDFQELVQKAKSLNWILYFDSSFPHATLKNYVVNFVRKKKHLSAGRGQRTLYARKFIVQEMIPGLTCDYKVLYFGADGGRYYVLRRGNRANDFRASGSHLFSFPETTDEIQNVLDLANTARRELQVPIGSFDIGMNADGECFLLEFQLLYFGPYTLQRSKWYFTHEEETDSWKRVDGESDLEEVYSESIFNYILEHGA